MSDKSNRYGYVGVDIPSQSFGSNKGVFNPAEINELVADNKWTQYGQLELIETKTISGVSSAIFTDIQESTYNVHFLTINDFQPATDATDCRIRFFENGVEETGNVYQYAYQRGSSAGTFAQDRSTGVGYLRAVYNVGNLTNEKGNSYTYFYNLGDNSKYSFTTHHMTFISDASSEHRMVFGSGVLPQASTVDQIKLYNASGNFTATASLYGIRYS